LTPWDAIFVFKVLISMIKVEELLFIQEMSFEIFACLLFEKCHGMDFI
jgi:hypothetical protein